MRKSERPLLKRHLARQFSRFLRHPLGLGLQADDLFLQLFLLRGGDGVDHGSVFLGDLDALFENGIGRRIAGIRSGARLTSIGGAADTLIGG